MQRAGTKIVAVIQARTGSSRLPGKVLRTVGDATVLEWVVHRVGMSQFGSEIVVATSDLPRDDAVVGLSEQLGVACFRGSEPDVLDRYYQAARAFDADIVIRVTADCALLDPRLLDEIVRTHLDERADYVTADGLVRGFAQESVSVEALGRAWRLASEPDDREHVTLYILNRPAEFTVRILPPPTELALPDWRLTLDTEEDYQLLLGLYSASGGELFDLSGEEIVALVANHPRLRDLATRTTI